MKPLWEKHLLHLHPPKASLTFGEEREEQQKKQDSAGQGPQHQMYLILMSVKAKARHGFLGAGLRSSENRAQPFRILKL